MRALTITQNLARVVRIQAHLWLLAVMGSALAVGVLSTSTARAERVTLSFSAERPEATSGGYNLSSLVSMHLLGQYTVTNQLTAFPDISADSGLATWADTNPLVTGELTYNTAQPADVLIESLGVYESEYSGLDFDMPGLGPVNESVSNGPIKISNYLDGDGITDRLLATLATLDDLPALPNEVPPSSSVNLSQTFAGTAIAAQLPPFPLIIKVTKSPEVHLEEASLLMVANDNSVFETAELPLELNPDDFQTLLRMSTVSDFNYEVLPEHYSDLAQFEIAEQFVADNLTSMSLTSMVDYRVASLAVSAVPEPSSLWLLLGAAIPPLCRRNLAAQVHD